MTPTAKTAQNQMDTARHKLWARIGQGAYKSSSRVSRFRRDLEAAYGLEGYSDEAKEVAYRASRIRNSYEDMALLYAVAATVVKGLAVKV